ncbi:hypothetical protein [Mesorhizobium sp. M2E.F.Ca.ET.209.01.1.1]|nr:hypothetical protein [Mesorhizobium sp. M2E.F.Ca.ET.209.01.1.1]
MPVFVPKENPASTPEKAGEPPHRRDHPTIEKRQRWNIARIALLNT